jgi:hypothetical protein
VIKSTHAQKNRFDESLELFESVVSSRWFLRSSVVLFLNKSDILEKKLEYDSFANYFPDFEGMFTESSPFPFFLLTTTQGITRVRQCQST